ncbi:MAG TPA: hypothetical protein VF107_01670, partial [Burkholderiaceae bacterium]
MPFADLRQRLAAAITAFTDAVASWVAPTLPWIFLALRRALIPTLVWLAVATLFFVLPQSREVLHGLSEPVLQSFAEFDRTDRSSINLWALISYVVTAVVLGFAIWYSARLLSTVDADRGAPNALEVEPGLSGLKRAVTWYPRGLGVSALAAAIGALIYANYTPRLSQWWALGLAVLAIAGPLVVAVGRLLGRDAPTIKSRVCIAIGVVATAAAFVLMWKLHSKWPIRLWCIGSAMLPALLFAFLVRRRQMFVRGLPREGHDAARARTFGDAIATVVVLVLGSGVALLLLALLPPVVMRIYGSAATALLFLAAAALTLTGAQLVFRRFASNVPGFTTAALALATLLIVWLGDEDLGSERLAPKPQALLLQQTAQPAGASSTLPAPRPLYVNAHGGGLRAAVFTAQVLARADDATCGAFGQQVAAFSGVSGGSVGIATYLLARQELVARGGWGACAHDAAGKPEHTPLADIVTGALVQDHLSPVISRMLAVDAPHLWGSPVRGQALLDSWNGALIRSLQARFEGRPVDDFAAFALPMAALTGGLAPAPAVYFNATDADSGHIVWFGNVQGGVAATYRQTPQAVQLSVGQAVLHSARFPIVTPAGAFDAPWAAGTPSARLVDGGYADNSGTTTLFDTFVAPANGQPRLINIDGNPSPDSQCAQDSGNPPLLTGVRGLLQARTAHASRAVERLGRRTEADVLTVQLDLALALSREPQRSRSGHEIDVCR